MRLARYHGLGNVYLVLEEGCLAPGLVQALCHPATGLGADGVLEPVEPPPGHDAALRIWNPDGSEAEKSGNGLRIFAQWRVDTARGGAREAVHTLGGLVHTEVTAHGVVVDMGRASFVPAEVPVLAEGPSTVELELTVEGAPRIVTAVGLGNPHAVLFVPSLPADWATWGASLERHPAFPRRTNVQVVVVGERLEAHIWERGAGVTPSSGSSACAVAAAAVATGRRSLGRHAVHMPGGVLHVTVGSGFELRLEGPVEAVGVVDVDARWLRARGA